MSEHSREPERTCVGCRTSHPRAALIRYVLSPSQQVLVDYRQRLPGRGVYTCCSVDCILRAVERKQLQRGLRADLAPLEGETLVAAVLDELLRRIENLLGMARKSGQILSGGQAILAGLRGGEDLAFVLLSNDISPAIAEKLLAAASRRNIESFQLLGKGRIGEILGKGERSVAAVHAGQLADALLLEMQRYKRMSREN